MIEIAELERVVAMAEEQGLSESLLDTLRLQFPGKHFTWCMDDDITTGKPVVMRERFAIYLVDSRDHCSCLTSDLNSASGIVLAEIMAD